MTKIICDKCERDIEPEEIVYQIISKPDSSFKTKILAKLCEKCFPEIRKEFIKTMGHDLIEC